MSAAADWPPHWLGFELLRRLPEYQAAWAEYRASAVKDPHGWATAIAALTREFGAGAVGYSRDQPSTKWAAEFGLQYMLDPAGDAESHGHIPWRPGSGAFPVQLVRRAESFVFDPNSNPPWHRGGRRYVALSFDLAAPIEAQIDEARMWLTKMAGKPAKATRGRANDDILKALAVLDLKADGATNRQIGQHFRPDGAASGHADAGAKLVKRARKLCERYRAIAGRMAEQGVDR